MTDKTSAKTAAHSASSAAAGPFVIAIDGPAASGKGTLAKLLARRYNLPHLDTGLTFRFVAGAMLAANIPLDDEEQAVKLAQNLDFSAVNKETLSADSIGTAASKISVMPGLRRVLAEKQRQFAAGSAGAVLDGRDIGTVICPDAQLKLFIIADVEIRAQRRAAEMADKGIKTDYETILAALRARDARDSERKTAPLKPAADAHLLDTTKLSIEETYQAACALADKVKAGKSAG